jgi:hypothetical protein
LFIFFLSGFNKYHGAFCVGWPERIKPLRSPRSAERFGDTLSAYVIGEHKMESRPCVGMLHDILSVQSYVDVIDWKSSILRRRFQRATADCLRQMAGCVVQAVGPDRPFFAWKTSRICHMMKKNRRA